MRVKIEDDHLDVVAQAKELTGNQIYPGEVIKKFQQRLSQIRFRENMQDLRKIKSLHIEKLEPKSTGKYSMRINDSWRIIFRLQKQSGKTVMFIEQINNHYG